MKRFISFVLCFGFLFGLTSCDEGALTSPIEQIIAVEYGSPDEEACEVYVSEGFTKVTYNSASDIVLAVENKKADCGIVDELELASFINAGRNIVEKEKCGFSIEYCAYFSRDNEALQESFNKAIREISGNGTLEKIKNANFNGLTYISDENDNEKGTLTMLCDPHFKNRVYLNNNEEIVGLDVDIAREICNYLGYGLEIITTDFDELFLKLEDGEGDFIMSACEVNEEREEYYLLSESYFTLDFYLIEKE